MMKGHSKGLVLLFATEMWERFGFYTMRALLVLYMVAELTEGGLGWSRSEAIALNGFYVGTAYLTPILGGYLSDRFLGQRRAAMIGAWLMALGYFLLVVRALPAFYCALGLAAVGNGFFKPCLTSILGQLYDKRDESERDGAYSIFYMGINIGGTLAGLAAGILLAQWGFYAGFATAGFGMLVGLAIFWWGKGRYLEDAGIAPKAHADSPHAKPLTAEERRRLWVIAFLFIVTTVFIAAWEQLSGLITLFIHNHVDRSVGSWEIPTPWLANVNPLLIVFFAPLISAIWAKLGQRRMDPYVGIKMGIGCATVALSFVVLSFMTRTGHNHWSLIMVQNVLVTIGELCVIPIGWAAVTRLMPPQYVSRVMGIMLGGIGLGSYLAGYIGSLVDVVGERAIFDAITIALAGVGMICFAVNPLLKRLDGSPELASLSKAA